MRHNGRGHSREAEDHRSSRLQPERGSSNACPQSTYRHCEEEGSILWWRRAVEFCFRTGDILRRKPLHHSPSPIDNHWLYPYERGHGRTTTRDATILAVLAHQSKPHSV